MHGTKFICSLLLIIALKRNYSYIEYEFFYLCKETRSKNTQIKNFKEIMFVNNYRHNNNNNNNNK